MRFLQPGPFDRRETGQPASQVLAVRWPRKELGRSKQVPRRWARTVPRSQLFFLWGALLGSGIATLIPYSVFVLMLGAQATVGVYLAAPSRAIFGATRQGLALVPVIRRFDPPQTTALLPKLRPHAIRLNALATLVGGAGLVATAWAA